MCEGDFCGVVPKGDFSLDGVAVCIGGDELQNIKVSPALAVVKIGKTVDANLNVLHVTLTMLHDFQVRLVVLIKIDPRKVLLIENHFPFFVDCGRWCLWILLATCHDTAKKDGSQWQ